MKIYTVRKFLIYFLISWLFCLLEKKGPYNLGLGHFHNWIHRDSLLFRLLSANPAAPGLRAGVQPPPPAQFPYPSLINDPVTARIRQYSLEDQTDASGPWSSIPESFEQLRSDLLIIIFWQL